jgi:hypothetical protein
MSSSAKKNNQNRTVLTLVPDKLRDMSRSSTQIKDSKRPVTVRIDWSQFSDPIQMIQSKKGSTERPSGTLPKIHLSRSYEDEVVTEPHLLITGRVEPSAFDEDAWFRNERLVAKKPGTLPGMTFLAGFLTATALCLFTALMIGWL